MVTQPVVSIIIDNYNYGRFLGYAIDSALSQSYEHLEVIVVDDGSTDDSREVVARYGERIVPVLKENGGQASAMNAGFARSRGDVVIFLDSDDALMPLAAEAAVDAFVKHPGTAKVEYRMEVIDEAGRPSGEIKPPLYRAIDSGDVRRRVLAFPFDMSWLATSGNAFSSTVLRRIFPIPEADFRILADFYLSHVAALFGTVVAVDDVMARYRIHGANNYQAAGVSLEVRTLPRNIACMRATNRQLLKYARELGLGAYKMPGDDILSVSYVANRLISRKVDSDRANSHDTIARLLLYGLIASSRRFDVSVVKRLTFAAWFVVMAIAPRSLAFDVALRFFFPQTRRVAGKLPRSLPGAGEQPPKLRVGKS